MILKSWLTGLAGAATLGLIALPAEAVTIGGVSALQGAAARTADVQPAHWYGRRYSYRPYYYGPRWRYRHGYDGYRPGFRYYYGPRYRYYGPRRHWRRW
jgi:hypothetical protein